MRVGLLEDDVSTQELLLLILQDEGYTVVNYASSQDCLESLGANSQTASVDLMIVDLHLMGPLSGFEVIREIRDKHNLCTLPIILTTAAILNDTEELSNLHVTLLEKPFAIDEMTGLIKQLVQPHSPLP